MDTIDPKTKLTRGAWSGPTLLAATFLLMLPAIYLIHHSRVEGTLISGVLGILLMIVALLFAIRSQNYFTGVTHMFYCDEKIIAIRETPRKLHFALPGDLQRIDHDHLGYTLVLKNSRRFRMRHKDAGPQHSAILKHWHATVQSARLADPPTT